MRYSLLDYLVDPATGQRFVVADAAVTRKSRSAGWTRCTHWCGRYGRTPESVAPTECEACLVEDLVEGTLQAGVRQAYPVVAGIPRVLPDQYLGLVPGVSAGWLKRHRGHVPTPTSDFDRLQIRTATAFGEEWYYFSENLHDHERLARCYFDLLSPEDFSGVVLDAGCGMGRWATRVAGRARVLMAVDLSQAVDAASRTLEGRPNTFVIQADLHHLPFGPASLDLIYSLGVLHHLPDPLVGLDRLVQHLKPGGKLQAYFYYALENRPPYFHVLLKLVSAVRFVLSRLPHALARRICFVIAIVVCWPLIKLGSLLDALGLAHVARQVPLYEFYADKSFWSLYNDSVDRFATRIEFRFTRAQIREMFAKVGLDVLGFSDTMPYWKVLGIRRTG